MKIFWNFFVLILMTVALHSQAHQIRARSGELNGDDDYKYPCPIKWKPYHLNDDPAKHGIKSGIYQPEDKAFIGRGYIKSTLTFGRIKIDHKPGFYTQMGGQVMFNDNLDEMWYLAKNPDCKYSWADPHDENQRKFVIDISGNEMGQRVVIPRYSEVPPMKGGLFYGDDAFASLKIRNITLEYMTCRSRYPLKPPTKPYNKFRFPAIIVRSELLGCEHTWKIFKNDMAPVFDGINAGSFPSPAAYVGMTKISQLWRPSRIQTDSPAGAYVLDNSREKFVQNESYYLVNAPLNRYHWVDAVGNEVVQNAVAVSQDSGPFRFPIGRAIINGRTVLGLTDGMGGLIYADEHGEQHVVGHYQVLVCEPLPRYKCEQIWKPYQLNDEPLKDGFSAGNYHRNIKAFIGRIPSQDSSLLSQHTIGRIQIAPQSNAGIYYFSTVSGREAFDNSGAIEYMVRNSDDVYEWVSSSSGKIVQNALKNQQHGRFEIGRVQIDDKVYVGAVSFMDGLVFTDYRGLKQTSRNYEVLTCSSSKKSDGF